MPRMWAQEWQTNSRQKKWSLHRSLDMVVSFGVQYNRQTEHSDKLSQVGKPYMANVSPEMYNYVMDSSLDGRLVTWRP